ncbi:MAG: 2-C-methyl-D-erythritol 4-phosphate cytidylyltransferase [Planctomycetes bacterium]|nr:2-C-methyl-D-erythritol 4-phosphate cytidylyltransferase [Planctomycetota bacterium]
MTASGAHRVSLVIPAAGRGTRFGGPVPKQLLPLQGRAVLLRSLDAFAGQVQEAVLAISDDARDEVAALIATAGLPFPVRLTTGGATRQDSVSAGLRASDPTCDLVLVHDAVRPLVPRSCIAACIAALTDHVAAVVAVPCAATVKRATAERTVDATVPRDDLWLAQTPQGLRRAEALAAFARAATEQWSCSDDVQVMERAGYRVALVMGDARNLKLTTQDDWAVAEALIG